jgi:hypothetical protein
MADPDRLTLADPADLAGALAYALRYQGRKRVHNANEIMAEIVARRPVEHLERSGLVVLRRPPEIGRTGPVDSTRSCRSNSYRWTAAMRKLRLFADGLANGSNTTLSAHSCSVPGR